MKEQGILADLPPVNVFRGWLLCAVADLELPAQVVSGATGGINAVGRFLSDGSKDLMLSRANAVETFVRAEAARKGRILPPVAEYDVRSYADRVCSKLDERFPNWRKSFADPAGCENV
ncbi:hypothetical protein ETW23_00350 [Leisingera sp. NJS201]|uniref:hypothetical protein n=1 Tax=Leisingera sp. NJS201 TaxID=2508306 RepID=UPI00107156B2|nr:hypothetical protein [Leisingera sp. NJS201]QBR34848.1 hypothetical protein ETW23_00350 [Leisingera sp. NJS201]